MKISRATPVLFVDRVEATRDFFTKVFDESAGKAAKDIDTGVQQ